MILTIIMHSTVTILSAYLFVIFAWWWWKQKKATTIYAFTCFLMLGISITNAGGIWLYEEKLIAGDLDLEMFVPSWWPWRQLLTIIPLVLYALYATHKICFLENGLHPKRRSEDLDKMK